jgi:hypothetical protein
MAVIPAELPAYPAPAKHPSAVILPVKPFTATHPFRPPIAADVAGFRAIVPVEVIVPPLNPAPAVMLVMPVAAAAAHFSPPEHAESAMRISPLSPTGSARGIEAADAVIKSPFAVRQLFGIARIAASYAVLTAREVAAVEELMLVTESSSCTTPLEAVEAPATLTTGLAPAVTLIGAVPVTVETAVPLDADVMRPCASTVIVEAV